MPTTTGENRAHMTSSVQPNLFFYFLVVFPSDPQIHPVDPPSPPQKSSPPIDPRRQHLPLLVNLLPHPAIHLPSRFVRVASSTTSDSTSHRVSLRTSSSAPRFSNQAERSIVATSTSQSSKMMERSRSKEDAGEFLGIRGSAGDVGWLASTADSGVASESAASGGGWRRHWNSGRDSGWRRRRGPPS